MMPVRILSVLGLILLVGSGLANGTEKRQKPTLKLSKRDRTVLGATILSSSRADIEKRLGKTEVFRTSRAEESDEVICYRSAAKDDDTVVVFSFGAMGGWIDLTEVSVAKATQLPGYARKCRTSTLVSRQIQFLRGLRLGSSPADVLERLGPPSRKSEEELSYYVWHKCTAEDRLDLGTKASDHDSPCEVIDSVTAKFKAGRLVHISFYHFFES